MADTTTLYEEDIIESDVVPSIAARAAGGTSFSWSAAIAGVFAAIAVSLLVVALGSGIGLSFASPYTGPSATTLTVAAAVWLVMAQAMGFATGGYVAARLRNPAFDGIAGDSSFRDAAEGLVVWALGVVILAAVTTWLAALAAGAGTHAMTAATSAALAPSAASSTISLMRCSGPLPERLRPRTSSRRHPPPSERRRLRRSRSIRKAAPRSPASWRTA